MTKPDPKLDLSKSAPPPPAEADAPVLLGLEAKTRRLVLAAMATMTFRGAPAAYSGGEGVAREIIKAAALLEAWVEEA